MDGQLKLGIEQATLQAKDLMEQGVPGMHFYVLNKSRSTNAVLEALHPPLD
jgi:methylenetetrahydrofolate reductase (NADPH)